MPGALLRSAVLTAAVGLWPCDVSAQAQHPAPPPTPRWDATFLAGGFSGRSDAPDQIRSYDSWFNTGLAAVVVGRHWTSHLKTELELAASGEGRQFVQRTITLPNHPYPVPYGSDQFTKVREAAATLTWQFFENQWAHPYLQAGLAVDIERQRFYTWPNTFYTGDPRLPGTQVVINERRDGPTTRTIARAVVGGGVKLYVTPRLFLRTDARAGLRARLENFAFRAGLGFDF